MYRFLLALGSALLLVAELSGPASAYSVISEVGPHGDFWLDDSSSTPGATCHYGDEFIYDNWSYLTWIQVRAPHVYAADRISDTRDHRIVTWQWQLQRHAYVYPPVATGWKTVANSAVQRKTAYEDAAAPFTSLRINYDGLAHANPQPPSYDDRYFRALVIIKWFKPNGTLESTVKLVPDFYRIKTFFQPDFTGGNPYCATIATSG